MRQDYHRLLKPEIVHSVSGLALISRLIVDGYLHGRNHSTRVGSGMEFSQYRAYQTGDDLRLLDWKMLARSGRYYIKQSEVETNISVKFILDASASMSHSEGDLSKMDYAKVLVASLAYLAQNQGDALGLFALNDQNLVSIYPKVQKQYYNRLLLELINISSTGKWPEHLDASRKIHDRTHKELIFFFTDMYEHSDELNRFIKRLKTLKNEVVVMHLMGKHELEFDYEKAVTFEDLETGLQLRVDPKEAKKHYLDALHTMIERNKDFLLSNDIHYHLFRLDEPFGEALKLFLKKRQKLI